MVAISKQSWKNLQSARRHLKLVNVEFHCRDLCIWWPIAGFFSSFYLQFDYIQYPILCYTVAALAYIWEIARFEFVRQCLKQSHYIFFVINVIFTVCLLCISDYRRLISVNPNENIIDFSLDLVVHSRAVIISEPFDQSSLCENDITIELGHKNKTSYWFECTL